MSSASPGSAGVRDLAGLIDKLTTAAEEAGRDQGYAAARGIAHTLTRMLAVGAARQALDDAIAELTNLDSRDADVMRMNRRIFRLRREVTGAVQLLRSSDPVGRDMACDGLESALADDDRLKAEMGDATLPVATGPRVPSPNWRPRSETGGDCDYQLDVAPFRAACSMVGAWLVMMTGLTIDGVEAYTIVAQGGASGDRRKGMLAAQDALAAIATAALRAIGR